MALFDSEFLKKLEYLALVARRVFRGELLAQRRTRQLGGGIEFADHREYVPGDDFRHVDWNVFARHDEMLLKRFQEEQDLHVYVLLDCSRSMSIGEKFDYARKVAAALAYIALDDLERVAISAIGERILDDFPLTRGKNRILTLLRFLESLSAGGGDTNFSMAADEFVRRVQRPGVVIVVSDFFDPRGFERGLDLLRYRQYEPHVVQVFDPRDADPDLLGDIELLDVETNGLRKVTVTEAHQKRYREVFAAFVERVLRYCRNYGLGCTQTSTELPFDELILRMMRAAGAVR
ncbi:MAG: DUF58 domain-containing protein [Phycisphaerales bacterium]|nr:DUF58 domain-containing protein [Phycisphaerales bacterium]